MSDRVVLGITGNIAAGKSTVVTMLTDKGARHLDADLVYRDLVRPGTSLLASLVDHFGKRILDADGSLDRKALGAIVFSDPAKLRELDALTHPAIIAETDRRAAEITEGVVIIDSVKLIETGHSKICDEVWLVTAPEEDQIRRLMARNHLSEPDARARVAAQPPLAPKLSGADVVIDNNGTVEHLRDKVDKAWHTLSRTFAI